jgi:hypothetical protein
LAISSSAAINPFQGTIDDVRIYNRALSASDILTLYNTTATACASPAGYTGDLSYNNASHVPQFCNGASWIPTGPVPGAGGGGCSSPSGAEGSFVYNADNHVLQYCDGANWVAAGENVPISGLAGWWNFDEGSGTSAADSSGNNNTGTLQNSPTWTTGEIGGAVGPFNGSNQNVTVPAAASLDLTGPWTVSTWVNLSQVPSSGASQTLLSRFKTAYANYALQVDNNNCCGAGLGWVIKFQNSGGTFYYSKFVTPISTGTWYHLAGTWDGTTLTMYVNGASAAASTPGAIPILATGTTLYLGSGGPSNFMYGSLDDARLYNRALSASEVWRLYNGAP